MLAEKMVKKILIVFLSIFALIGIVTVMRTSTAPPEWLVRGYALGSGKETEPCRAHCTRRSRTPHRGRCRDSTRSIRLDVSMLLP